MDCFLFLLQKIALVWFGCLEFVLNFCKKMKYRFFYLQRVRKADLGDVVVLDTDSNKIETPFQDLESLPPDVVSIFKMTDQKYLGHNLLWENQALTNLYELFFFKSVIIQIVCSDCSNPSTSQCMCGRPVMQWSAVALLYPVVFLKSLDFVFIYVVFSFGKKKKKKTQRSKYGE